MPLLAMVAEKCMPYCGKLRPPVTTQPTWVFVTKAYTEQTFICMIGVNS